MISADESGSATPFVGNNRSDIPMIELDRNAAYDGRSVGTMDNQSQYSLDLHGPQPTSPEDNSRLTSQYFTLVTSIIYAVLLVTLGFIVYPGDTIAETVNMAMIYSICLYALGFVYILFLMIDINRYKCIKAKNQKKSHEEQNVLMSLTNQVEGSPEVLEASPPCNPSKPMYCFSEGRHAESFYLKLGATGFAIGHLVHSMLQLVVELGYLLDDNGHNNGCTNKLGIVLGVLTPCYCILQLYFMFKYSNVIILRFQGLAHFAFMHLVASSLCFWLSAIVRDSTLTLTIYAHSVYGKENKSLTYSPDQINKKFGTFIDIQGLYNEKCAGSEAINTIMGKFSPYLYPFTVEFNILIVAVYYIIWSNIGNNASSEAHSGNTPGKLHDENNDDDDHRNSDIMIHADCGSSIRGLFAGIILMVFVIGNIILGFVLGTVGGKFQTAGYFLKDIVNVVVHSSMLLAAVAVFKKLRSLDINEHPMSLLDDVLLFICLPAFFMETVLSMIATINILNVLKCIDVVIMVVQVVIQTTVIMDGLRRCSNSKKLRRSKPGRELVMFLLIANVSMWLFYTFSYKSPESLDERYEFYGKVLWTVLGHISLPLTMFYCFHSSVCLADIWASAYKPGGH